jgi:hypothetical protein
MKWDELSGGGHRAFVVCQTSGKWKFEMCGHGCFRCRFTCICKWPCMLCGCCWPTWYPDVLLYELLGNSPDATLVLENSDELICKTNKTRSTCIISRLRYSHLKTRDSRVFFRDGGSIILLVQYWWTLSDKSSTATRWIFHPCSTSNVTSYMYTKLLTSWWESWENEPPAESM